MKKSQLTSLHSVLILVTLHFLSSCSTGAEIKPDSENPVEINGRAAQVGESEGCKLSAYSLKNGYSDLLVGIRVENETKAAFDVSASQFALTGPALRGETLAAVDASTYLAKLSADADNLESRANGKSWDGVDVLTQTMPDDQLRSEYEKNQKDIKKDLKAAKEIRKKEEYLRPLLMKTTSLKPGETFQGNILFPGPFAHDGKVSLNLVHPKCGMNLGFTLSK